MIALLAGAVRAQEPAAPVAGARVYADLTSSVLFDGAALNVEYRSDWVAVSVGAGAGGMFVADAVTVGAGAGAQVHFLSASRKRVDAELAIGVGAMRVDRLSCFGLDPSECGPRWIPWPLGFAGVRFERPRAPIVRVGLGVGFASAGLQLSVGWHSPVP